jgi:hypothetical protein
MRCLLLQRHFPPRHMRYGTNFSAEYDMTSKSLDDKGAKKAAIGLFHLNTRGLVSFSIRPKIILFDITVKSPSLFPLPSLCTLLEIGIFFTVVHCECHVRGGLQARPLPVPGFFGCDKRSYEPPLVTSPIYRSRSIIGSDLVKNRPGVEV